MKTEEEKNAISIRQQFSFPEFFSEFKFNSGNKKDCLNAFKEYLKEKGCLYLIEEEEIDEMIEELLENNQDKKRGSKSIHLKELKQLYNFTKSRYNITK